MQRLLFFVLMIMMLGCSSDPTVSTEQRAPASAAAVPCELCGTWEAVRLTINGKGDPERDPKGKAEWVIRVDSTFAMRDATEGALEQMEGRWRLDKTMLLTLMGPPNEGELQFKVRNIENGSLVLQVVEETEAEVLLHFKAK